MTKNEAIKVLMREAEANCYGHEDDEEYAEVREALILLNSVKL